MAMRQQFKEYRLDPVKYPQLAPGGNGRVELGNEKNGNVPIQVLATEFVVINRLGASPMVLSTDNPKEGGRTGKIFMQLRLNTTDYFVDDWRGVSNSSFPYPFPDKAYQRHHPGVEYPDDFVVYVLPGNRFSVVVVLDDGTRLNPGEYVNVCIDYMLFDGTDSVVAYSLLECGRRVCQDNIDMYKMRTISAACNHDKFYVVHDTKCEDNNFDFDVSAIKHFHEVEKEIKSTNEWHEKPHDDIEVYCFHCHEKLSSFVSITRREYEKQFIMPKTNKKGA